MKKSDAQSKQESERRGERMNTSKGGFGRQDQERRWQRGKKKGREGMKIRGRGSRSLGLTSNRQKQQGG